MQRRMQDVEKVVLPSGMTLLLLSDDSLPVVACQLWVKVGSGYEPSHEVGISHFIEHLVFKGTRSFSAEALNREVESAGGSINAFTSMDVTGYHVVLPKQHIDLALKILIELVQVPTFPDNEFDREKQVILEELAEEEDNNEITLGQRLFNSAFQDDPYANPVIGYKHTVTALTLPRIKAFFKAYYTPPRMVLAVAGDFDIQTVKTKVSKQLHASPNRDLAAIDREVQPLKPGFRWDWLCKGSEESAIEIAFRLPAMAHQHTAYLDLAANILGGGECSRLYQQLCEKDGLVRSIDATYFSQRRHSLLLIRALLTDGDFSQVYNKIARICQEMRDSAPSPEEMQLAKVTVEKDLMFETETYEGIANNLAFYETTVDDCMWERFYLKSVMAAKAKEVGKVCQAYLRPDNIATVGLSPTALKPPFKADELEKLLVSAFNSKPVSPKPCVVDPPQKSTAGRRLQQQANILIRSTASPIATIFLTMPGGLLCENQHNNGIGQLALAMLATATSTQSALQLAKSMTLLGAEFEASLGRSSIGLRMDLPSRYVESGVDLFLEVVAAAVFQQPAFAREKVFQLQEIRSQQDSFETICLNNLLSQLFVDHPYGLNPIGATESVDRLTLDDVSKHYWNNILSQPWTLAVVSSQKPEQVRRNLESKLPGQSLPIAAAAKTTFTEHQDNKRVVATIPGKKAYLYFGWRTPAVSQGLWPALEVLTGILTGFGGGKLYHRLREELGLAYTVHTVAYHGSEAGYFAIQVNTTPDHVEAVIAETEAILATASKETWVASELQRAKNYLIGSYDIELQKSATQAMHMAINHQFGLGADLGVYSQAILNVTTSAVCQTVVDFLQPEQMVLSLLTP